MYVRARSSWTKWQLGGAAAALVTQQPVFGLWLPLATGHWPIPYHRPPSPAWFLKLFVNWPLQIQIEKWKREEPAKMVQSFHGNPQIASLRGCKVTLLAFV